MNHIFDDEVRFPSIYTRRWAMAAAPMLDAVAVKTATDTILEANDFLNEWEEDNPDHPDIETARRLLAESWTLLEDLLQRADWT